MRIVTVTDAHKIKDHSGDFACPSCWLRELTHIKYPDDYCSKRGVKLFWNVWSVD